MDKFQKIKRFFQLPKRIFHRFAPREKYIASIFALVIVGSLVALGVQVYISNTITVPKKGGTYREAVVGTPRFINPVLVSTNDVDRGLTNLVYSSLMRYNEKGELVPDLAKSYEVRDEGKTYVFNLKEDLQWEDGEELTAEDVVYTINLVQDPGYASPLFQSWQGVEVERKDKRTVIFRLEAPYASFIENTTIGILPKHKWQSIPQQNFALSDANLQPLGSGRYKVESLTKNESGLISSYTLTENKNYHGKQPFIEKIVFKFYANEEEAIKAFNAGLTDGISFVSPANIEKLNQDAKLNLFNMPRYFAIFFNQEQSSLLNNIEVREALARSTNKEEIIEKALAGFGEKAFGPIPENFDEYHSEDVEKWQYDPERAETVLEENGWEDQDEDGIREKLTESENDNEEKQRLEFSLVTADRPELKKAANILQNQWEKSGIKLNVKTVALDKLQQNFIRPRSYQMLMFGQILGSVPDPFSFWHSSQTNDPGLNLSRYSNEDVDTLLEDMRTEEENKERIEKYKEFQQKLTEDLPAIFIYNPKYIYATHKRVKGVEEGLIVDSSYRFTGISEWYVRTQRVF